MIKFPLDLDPYSWLNDFRKFCVIIFLKLMHELSITQNILDIALEYAQRYGAQKILEIHLQIGEISDFEDEWLQRYFDFLSKDTIAAGAKVKIERIPAKGQCAQCLTVFLLDSTNWDNKCPVCGEKNWQIISGRELRVEALEVI